MQLVLQRIKLSNNSYNYYQRVKIQIIALEFLLLTLEPCRVQARHRDILSVITIVHCCPPIVFVRKPRDISEAYDYQNNTFRHKLLVLLSLKAPSLDCSFDMISFNSSHKNVYPN